MLYEFVPGHNTTEATKNICFVKNESAVDHSRVARWFKKFCSGHKNFDNRATSGRSKSVDWKAMCYIIAE